MLLLLFSVVVYMTVFCDYGTSYCFPGLYGSVPQPKGKENYFLKNAENYGF